MKALILSACCLLGLAACNTSDKSDNLLPIYGNREAVTKTVNGKTVTDTVYHTIPDFETVNQYGKKITRKSLDGSIYVADFFFTSCPSICPIMHRNMLKVYDEFKKSGNVKIVSYSIDPRHDSVAVLKNYADKMGITGNNWWFLQGDKQAIYKLAESYLVAVMEDNKAPGGYVHQGYFVLIDKQKRIRGSYDGTNPEQVANLIKDIKLLQTEPQSMIAQ
ncbi:SCO family protein [Mucilaginibacter aquatilis]|uniref:Redoxin family protein n=1 Tax=Mucilaginibacter aquatilis TaxID=1517760 RepID=A0A6I4IQG9_9SPHI|nr:SCO family protein [Mucilaginibacter aquatilis]MVN91124.1 redoxin family protein [Mucilaginibacter aquatilis]